MSISEPTQYSKSCNVGRKVVNIKGEKGEQGEAGDPGPVGEKGDTGDQGPPGILMFQAEPCVVDGRQGFIITLPTNCGDLKFKICDVSDPCDDQECKE